MNPKTRAVVAALVTLAGALAPITAAAASLPRPVDLQVVGGGEWHAVNSFMLTWTDPESRVPALVARTTGSATPRAL